MFSVYGVGGQLFRGSMEQLRQIKGLGRSVRSNRVQAVDREGRDHSLDVFDAVAKPGAEVHRSVLNAYAQTGPMPARPRQPARLVAELMSRNAISISADATTRDAWQTLLDSGVGQVPVLNQNATLVGLLARSDLFAARQLLEPDAGIQAWRSWLAQSVADVMVTPVPSVGTDTDVRHVARVLVETGLSGLPVVDAQGTVCGFISRSDIVRAVITEPPLDLWG